MRKSDENGQFEEENGDFKTRFGHSWDENGANEENGQVEDEPRYGVHDWSDRRHQDSSGQNPYSVNPYDPRDSFNDGYNQGLKLDKANKWAIAAMVCALVSLFIGGVFLSAAALIFALVARRYMKEGSEGIVAETDALFALRKRVKLAIVISAIALVLSIISFAIMMPNMIEYMNAIDSSLSNGGALSGPGTNSTWG